MKKIYKSVFSRWTEMKILVIWYKQKNIPMMLKMNWMMGTVRFLDYPDPCIFIITIIVIISFGEREKAPTDGAPWTPRDWLIGIKLDWIINWLLLPAINRLNCLFKRIIAYTTNILSSYTQTNN